MKFIKQFESYNIERKRTQYIKEAVLQVNDIYKVKTMIDIPQSLINAYVKKVKDTLGKDIKQFFSDIDIVEEIVKYINTTYLNVDNIPAGALTGDVEPEQIQAQDQAIQNEVDDFESQGQAQVQDQVQDQVQVQAQDQIQDQAQMQAQTQAQGQAQAQSFDEFEEPQTQSQFEEEENEEEDDEGFDDEKLPI